MFAARVEAVVPGDVDRYELIANGSPLTFDDVLNLLSSDSGFREFYSDLLGSSPFTAFRWETPALTLTTAIKPFEFVLLNSPEFCSRPADAEPFADYFTDDETNFGVVNFDNLGGDSSMIVPSPRATENLYGHFASFIRNAPKRQVDALLRTIGSLATLRLAHRPIWINTAGGGVAWLHVRLDSRPKYYRYKPYRQPV